MRRRVTEKWYFQHNGKLEGSGYFVGYDFKSFLCIGYIGRNGFRHDEPPEDEQFPVDGRQMENNSSVLAEIFGIPTALLKRSSRATNRFLQTW